MKYYLSYPYLRSKNKKVVKKNKLEKINLRYKGLISVRYDKSFFFSDIWKNFFLIKACKIVEKIIKDRGIVYIFYNNFISKFNFSTFNKLESTNIFFYEKGAPFKGFISNFKTYKNNRFIPDLVIFLNKDFEYDNSIISEGLSLKIPFISPIGNLDFKNIPYPILIDVDHISKILLILLKSLERGKAVEKKQIRNVKVKKV